MSAIAAHYASVPDRRYPDPYDPAAFFHSYSHPSLNAVTTPAPALDSPYALAPPSSYVWDTHHSESYPTSSSSPAYSSPSSAHTGPSSLASYPADYRSLPPPSSRSAPYNHLVSSPASPHSPPLSSRSYAAASRSYSSLASTASNNISTRLQNVHWSDANPSLYTIDPADPVSASLPSSSPSAPPTTPPIKEEDAEGEFIIEVSVPAEPVLSSMPEVPLRATHAPPSMRKMMYSFRLENFAMHDGIRSAATQPGPGGVEVGPLKEEGVELEWQLHLDHPLIPEQQDESFAYAATAAGAGAHFARSSGSGRASVASSYRQDSPASTKPSSTRGGYASTAGSASPALSVDYPSAVDNDTWEASSGYESVAGNSSSSASTASPTFTSVMTPAQSLGWSSGTLRHPSEDVELDTSIYRRSSGIQSSLSRVSQGHGQYAITNGGKSPYQQASSYGYDSSGYSRSAVSGRYPSEVYASSWYRSS